MVFVTVLYSYYFLSLQAQLILGNFFTVYWGMLTQSYLFITERSQSNGILLLAMVDAVRKTEYSGFFLILIIIIFYINWWAIIKSENKIQPPKLISVMALLVFFFFLIIILFVCWLYTDIFLCYKTKPRHRTSAVR